jgi:N-acyl homoserine lactone hydrolase
MTRLGRQVLPLRLAAFPYPDRHPLAGMPGVLYAYALVREGSTILYDTGIGFGSDWVDRTFQHNTRDVRTALQEVGVDPTSVERIVHSHLHFDHCGQDRSFPGIPIVVQRIELESARQP